jgi:hypothetical protein
MLPPLLSRDPAKDVVRTGYDDHLLVPLDHINFEAIDHLAEVIPVTPVSIRVMACSSRLTPPTALSLLVVIGSLNEGRAWPGWVNETTRYHANRSR